MRTISDNGLEILKQAEGLRLKAYQDQAGVWTIGWGTTEGVYQGMEINKEQATDFLMKDLQEFEDCVYNSVKVKLTENQFDALVIFVYNIGAPRFKTSTLLELLNEGHYDKVPAQLARWNKINGVVNQGLINRRKREIDLWNQKPQPNDKWYKPILKLIS